MLLEYIFLHFGPTHSVYKLGIFTFVPICPSLSINLPLSRTSLVLLPVRHGAPCSGPLAAAGVGRQRGPRPTAARCRPEQSKPRSTAFAPDRRRGGVGPGLPRIACLPQSPACRGRRPPCVCPAAAPAPPARELGLPPTMSPDSSPLKP